MTPLATITIHRDPASPTGFRAALEGFHYEGEGRFVTVEQLEALIGRGAVESAMEREALESEEA